MPGMEAYSPVFVVSAFIAGGICGGALVMIQRYIQIEMLKSRFQQELAAMCERHATAQMEARTAFAYQGRRTQEDQGEEIVETAPEPEHEWIAMAPAVVQATSQHVNHQR